ncbi:hypothetical protein [Microbispora sp. NPDC049633]|uniref:hypothetical protein n=1 Tax=Microbispora sp. NPDC049633 TaxID=3154355 RepID=UPI003447358F
MVALAVTNVLVAFLQSPTASNALAQPTPTPAPAATSAHVDTPRPYRPVERPESELHKKLAAQKPDFGDDDRISKAWSRGEIGVDEYIRNTIWRVADPSRLPKKFRSNERLSHRAGLSLTYALSLLDEASAETQAWVKSLAVRPVENKASSTTTATRIDCATPYIQFVNWFTCKRSLSIGHAFDIYYNIDGFSVNPDTGASMNGIPDVDVSPSNGVPDAIDKVEASLRTAWSQYQSMGYGLTGNRVEIYIGFDYNDNPGLTFPFGDILDDHGGPVIFLPTDPAEFEDQNGNPYRNEDWYTYLIRHELFHAVQYHYLPNLHFFGNIVSINWWMEATAEWAVNAVYRQVSPAEAGWGAYARTLDSFLAGPGGPESALNSSDGLGGSRQYGAFIFAQYLVERAGTTDFVRRTWEVMDSKMPLEAIDQVLSGYGLDLNKEVQGFAVANYRLTGKTANLSAFLGAADGYANVHASGLWRNELDGKRPKRSAEKTMTWGGSANGSTMIWHGGASYVEFTPPPTGNGRLSVRVEAPDQGGIDSEVEFHYFLVAWDNLSSMTPLRWARADARGDDETHELTIKMNAGETATLIAVRSDLWQESQKIPNGYSMGQVVNWTASMAVEANTGMNGALNAMWAGYANNAGCADWSGGDAAQAVKLPSGKRAWFFSDTFLGDPSKRSTGSDTSYIRNSIVVQDGSALRTITGGSTCRETSPNGDFWSRYAKTPVGEGGQYWTGDSKVVNENEVVKFYYEGVGDENTRGAYARLSIADLETKSVADVTPTRLQECSVRNPYPIIWGASLLDHDGYTYIYGWEADGSSAEKSLFLARTPVSGDLGDQSRWRYFAGTGSDGSAQWAVSCATSKPLQPKVEIDFSVVHINGLFWLVRHTPASQAPGKIVALPSRSAWGFGSEQIDLYTPPETKTNPAYSAVYGARVQAGVLPDNSRVLISYTVSTSTTNVSCWTRGYYFPDNQYPRFIDVPISQFFSTKIP